MILIKEQLDVDNFPDFPCRSGDFEVYMPEVAKVNVFTFLPGKPLTFEVHLINLCDETTEIVLFDRSVIAQDDNNRYYFVGDGLLVQSLPTRYRIAIKFDFDCHFQWFYSEVYSSQTVCTTYKLIEAIGDIADNVYSGLPKGDIAGDSSLFYIHRAYLESAELKLIGYKMSFSRNSRRNFKTEKEKTYELRPKLVPQWYMDYLFDIYSRGDIAIDQRMYTISSLQSKLINECEETWKPWVQLVETDKRYFGCESRVPDLLIDEVEDVSCCPTYCGEGLRKYSDNNCALRFTGRTYRKYK